MRQRCILYIHLAAALCAAPALAEAPAVTPPPFAEFTFKRVGVPSAGSGNRINVQIDPSEQAAALPAVTPDEGAGADTATATATATGAYAWFWEQVSPARADAGPANLTTALAVLRDAPSAPTPRLQYLQDIAALHGLDILRATIGTRISPAFVLAVISAESGGDVSAVSSAGAQGIMQLIPDTAERFGVTDALDPADNIKGGVAYLNWLMETFDSDPILALAGYNAGENAVRRNEGVPPFAETRTYIPRVLSAWQVARGLCVTPPELISDGCVFAVRGSPDNG